MGRWQPPNKHTRIYEYDIPCICSIRGRKELLSWQDFGQWVRYIINDPQAS